MEAPRAASGACEPVDAGEPVKADADAPEDERPGVLRGTVTLTLHTRQAERLVKGRAGTAETPAIVGLVSFANLLRPIWEGARADDPYADWWLLKVEDALARSERRLLEASRSADALLEASGPLTVSGVASLRPARIAVRFGNPYAFKGARLLGAYDDLACRLLTARYLALMTADRADELLASGGRDVRRAFLSPTGYRSTGVTRKDFLEGTEKAREAQAEMGELPPEVLAGGNRAPHAPARSGTALDWPRKLPPQSPPSTA